MSNFTKYFIVLMSLFFVACGSGGTANVTELPLQKGYFGDPPVKGLGFECGNIKDVTDDEGMFACFEFPVTFKMGNLTLGSLDKITADKKVYPQDIVGKLRSDFSDEKVINLARLLQSLDNDGYIEKKIQITEEVSQTFTTEQNLSKLDDGEVETLVEDSGKIYIAEDKAIEKLKENLEKLISITISPEDATIPLGKSVKFSAEGVFSNAVKKDITKDVSWSLLSNNIAFLNGVEVRARSIGKTTLSASYKGITQTVEIIVSAANLILLDISSLDREIAEGSEMQLSAIGTFSDESTNEMTSQVIWSSSDESVASVDKDGNVKALKSGTVTISIKKDSILSSKTIEINKAELTNITVTPETQSIVRGFEGEIIVTGVYTNGQTQVLTNSAKFYSSDEIVAFVNDGKITALNAGTATITVKSGNFTAQTEVIVTANIKQDLLDVHNKAREEVGVKSKLTWSDKIAIDAKSYAYIMATTGVWEHDPKNLGGYTNGYYGENLYIGEKKPTFAESTKAWVDEKAFYHYGKIGDDSTCDVGEMCGHYTQVIWEDTTEVGCAMSQYKTGEYKDWYIVVCKYQTPGNYLNEKPYVIIP